MATRSHIVCGCGALSDSNRCPDCRKRAEKENIKYRGTAAERGYDLTWRKFRAWFVKRHPLCEDCLEVRRVMPTQEVHHLKKVREYPELRLVESNCRGLCKSCHSKRTERGE